MKKLKLFATATFGVEAVVARELKHLGYEDTSIDNGKIFLQGILRPFAGQISGCELPAGFMY